MSVAMDPETNLDSLSQRERQIAEAYANGASYRQIAESLYIAPATVRTHLATIYRKLGTSSKIELHAVLMGQAPGGIAGQDQSALISELALSLEEALSRERALGEVLRIISRAKGELTEVIALVLEYALDLCNAKFGILFEYNHDVGYRATYSLGIPQPFAEWIASRDTLRPGAQTGLGRIVTTRQPVNIADVRGEMIYRNGDPLRIATVDLGGARSFAAIPMLAGERLIGAFTVYRQQVRPFDDKSLALAQVFADQSAIAIENARMMAQLSPTPETASPCSDDADGASS